MGRAAMMQYGSGRRKTQQVQFGGYNHSAGSSEGQIWDERNMSSLAYPFLRPRRNRPGSGIDCTNAIFAHNALGWVDGIGLWYDGHLVGYVEDSQKQIAVMGNRIVIWPDKLVLNATYKRLGVYASLTALKNAVKTPTENDAYGVGSDVPYEIYVYNGSEWVSNGKELQPMEASASFSKAKFMSGTYREVPADANTMELPSTAEGLGFKVGDAVTIRGCTKHPENNKTAIVREIEGKQLRFYENAFVLDGEDGLTDYEETGTITISREVPEMDVICAANNRLWGAKDDTIYASALGDPMNFHVFDGLTTDSWFQTTGQAGRFTGCTMYLGYPMFFKENLICKIYGSNAENFQTSLSATMGVKEGAYRSMAIAGEVLYYLSANGMVAYTGGLPESIAAPFGAIRYTDCVTGTDGRRLYLSMERATGEYELFCLDTENGILRKEDGAQVRMWANYRGALHGMEDSGASVYNADELELGCPDSMVEFGDIMEQTMDRKSTGRLQMRLTVAEGAELRVSVQYDSDGVWRPVKTFRTTKKMSFSYPVKLRRCDHYRIRIEATGYWELQAMARDYAVGSGVH